MLTIDELYKFCEFPNRPASPKEIDALEAALKIHLPEDYRQFLLERNGGEFSGARVKTPWHPDAGDQLHSLYGVGAGVDSDAHTLGTPADIGMFEDNLPIRVLPIGETLLGHLILMTFGGDAPNSLVIKKAFDKSGYKAFCNSFRDLFEKLTPPAS